VIRAAQDRAVVDFRTGKPVGRLFAQVRAASKLGEFHLKLRARPGRVALAVSATPVQLRAPQRPGQSAGKNPPISCSAVRVWEREAPAGVEPLEWILLCDREVESFRQARECAWQYATRWLIEELHKALKSGLGAERLQLQTAARLWAAIAIMSVVALRLIELRERVRIWPEAAAEKSGLDELELEVLRRRSGKEIRTFA